MRPCDTSATEMAFPGYTKMGFETVVRYTTFVAA